MKYRISKGYLNGVFGNMICSENGQGIFISQPLRLMHQPKTEPKNDLEPITEDEVLDFHNGLKNIKRLDF